MATAVRVSNTVIEVLADWDPSVRVSTTYIEVLADWDPFVRVSNTYAEVLADWDPFVRVSNTFVEVLADWDPLVRVTQYHLEVIRDSEVEEPPPPSGKQFVPPRRPGRPPELFFRPERFFLPMTIMRQVVFPPLPMPLIPIETGLDQWWMDYELGGFWPIDYAVPEFDPAATVNVPSQGTFDQSEVLIGCRDGYVRKLDRTVFQDDGVPFTSKVMLGPFLIGDSSLSEGLVEDIEGVLTTVSGQITWHLRVHREWEDAAKEATTEVASGTWGISGVNPHKKVRRRGTAYSVLLVNAQTDDGWSFEECLAKTSIRGRRRVGLVPGTIVVSPPPRPPILTPPGVPPVPPFIPPSPDVDDVTPNDSSIDNTTAFEDLIEQYSASGSDLGKVPIGPGIFRFEDTPVINHEVGSVIEGQGKTDATGGPRIWGGWTTFVNGSALYADPTAAESGTGAVIEVHNVRELVIRDLDLFLAAAVGGNYRLIGMHFTNPDSPSRGPGEQALENVSIVYPLGSLVSGMIGLKFGESTGDLNIDTTTLRGVSFKGIETCMQVVHNQGLVWRLNDISIRQCETFAHFLTGGNFSVTDWHWADALNSSLTKTMVKVDSAGGNTGHFYVGPGYIDRTIANQTFTIFDFKNALGLVEGECIGVNVRNLSGTPDHTSSGAPYFDLGEKNTVNCIGGRLVSQPIVRWNATTNKGFRAVCTVMGSQISGFTTRSIPREMVTSIGGYNGHLRLISCTSDGSSPSREIVDATVGIYPVAGNRHSHSDWQASGIPSYDGLTDLQTFANSWLQSTHSPSGHWKFDEAIGATTAADSTAGGNDLTIDADMQVSGSPVPWLEQSCDFEQSTANNGRDTGISITPGTDDFLLTGFARIGTSTGSSPIAAIATGTRFTFFRMTGSGGVVHHGPVGSTFFVETIPNVGMWFHFTVYCDTSADTVKTFIDGVLVDTQTSAGWNGTAGSGNLWIGGDSTTNGRWAGSLSRVSAIVPASALTDEDIDMIFRSATFFRENRGQRPV